MARTTAMRECRITSKFKEEKFIPLIRLTRKLSSCTFDKDMKLMQQLARVFQSDEVSFSLMDILITGFCQRSIYEEIPNALYREIDFILPSDKELNLKDTVFESRLVEEQESANILKKKEKLPMTLLRIPSDLQCHLFHFLHFKELTNIQSVCRALFIAARNPSAVLSLEFEPILAKTGQYQNECYSRPRFLTIPTIRPSPMGRELAFIGNERWGNHVVDLCIWNYCGQIDVAFPKLEKCKISGNSSILLSGSISSYHTLKELTLQSLILTKDVLHRIRRFENLEKLHLRYLYQHPDQLEQSDPISFPNLRSISYQVGSQGFREFQRFLIGSNPQTVFNVKADGFYVESSAVPDGGFIPIPKRPAIQQFNVNAGSWSFFDTMTKWLGSAHASNFKVFEQINCSLNIVTKYQRFLNMIIPPLITLCQYSNKSKLEIKFDPLLSTKRHYDMDEVVNKMLNAPFATFTEIKMERTFRLLSSGPRNESESYVKCLLDQLDREEDGEKRQNIVHDVVNQSIDDAEKWMKPCLLFNEERMKQIGVENVDITFVCDLELQLGLWM